MKTLYLSNSELLAEVDDNDFPSVAGHKWRIMYQQNKKVHAVVRSLKIGGKFTIGYLHRHILGICDGDVIIDHIDGNPLNNQRSNLRTCNRKQNSQNSARYSSNKTGYKGVYFDKQMKKFRARIVIDGKSKHIGLYNTVEEAGKAYDAEALKAFGEFARTNERN